MFLLYLVILRNFFFIHNKYCNLLYPNNFIGVLCKNLITFFIDFTLVTFKTLLFFLSKEIVVVKDKYLRTAESIIRKKKVR